MDDGIRSGLLTRNEASITPDPLGSETEYGFLPFVCDFSLCGLVVENGIRRANCVSRRRKNTLAAGDRLPVAREKMAVNRVVPGPLPSLFRLSRTQENQTQLCSLFRKIV